MNKTISFHLTDAYIATDAAKQAINAAFYLEQPLLIRGESGTGKTALAEYISRSLKTPLLSWHLRSTTTVQQGLYEYHIPQYNQISTAPEDTLQDIQKNIHKGIFWRAFESKKKSVILIDGIDKANLNFCNDLLPILDQLSFDIPEIHHTIRSKHKPFIIFTCNHDQELPDSFLRRCFFHFLHFPELNLMQKIVSSHFPDIQTDLLNTILNVFYYVRHLPGIKKKPSIAELLDWIQLLLAENISIEILQPKGNRINLPPFHGALLKHEQDTHLFERLVFMNRATL
jgi:MoxR-like ATPase